MLHLVYGTNSLIFASLVRHSLLHFHLSHSPLASSLTRSVFHSDLKDMALQQILSSTDSFLSGLIPRTLGPFDVFILLKNGWICLHDELE